MEPLAALQAVPGPLDVHAGRLLVALVVVGVVVVVGRRVLAVAWRLVVIAAIAVLALVALRSVGLI